MKKFETPIVLIVIHDEDVSYRRYEWRAVLAYSVKADFNTEEFEPDHRCNAFDASDHAGGDSRQEKFCVVEGIGATALVGIERDRLCSMRCCHEHQFALPLRCIRERPFSSTGTALYRLSE